MKRTILILAFAGFAMAGDGLRQNEDLQAIRAWQQEQRAQTVANALDLTVEQVATLRGIKEQVEAVNASYRTEIEALNEEIASGAAEIRANLDAAGTLSEPDLDRLKSFKQQRRALGKERRQAVAEAAQGLKELLTDEQVAILKMMGQDRRAERTRNREGGDRGKQRAKGRGQRAAARFLLSDAFLNQYQ